MTIQEKETIDAMSLEDMLRRWRFDTNADDYFSGDRGKYFSDQMFKLRDANPEAWTAASKRIGW